MFDPWKTNRNIIGKVAIRKKINLWFSSCPTKKRPNYLYLQLQYYRMSTEVEKHNHRYCNIPMRMLLPIRNASSLSGKLKNGISTFD